MTCNLANLVPLLIVATFFVLGAFAQCNCDNTRILWDVSHGIATSIYDGETGSPPANPSAASDPRTNAEVFIPDADNYINDKDAWKWDDFVGTGGENIITNLGFQIDYTDQSIAAINGSSGANMSQYDILIIAASTTYDSPYVDEELKVISDFVLGEQEGSVLLLGERTGSQSQDNIQPIIEYFGLGYIGRDTSVKSPHGADVNITDFPSNYTGSRLNHTIFQNIDELEFAGVSRWTYRFTTQNYTVHDLPVVFRDSEGQEESPNSIIVTWKFCERQRAKMFWMFDESVFTTTTMGRSSFSNDNPAFVTNVMNWLAGCSDCEDGPMCVPLELPGEEESSLGLPEESTAGKLTANALLL